MKTRGRRVRLVAGMGLLVMSCMLPGMIPLKSAPEGPMPYMEENTDEVIKTLSGEDWVPLQPLAPEKHAGLRRVSCVF